MKKKKKKKILINSGNHTEDLFQKAGLGDQELFDIWHEWGSELFFFLRTKQKKKNLKNYDCPTFFFQVGPCYSRKIKRHECQPLRYLQMDRSKLLWIELQPMSYLATNVCIYRLINLEGKKKKLHKCWAWISLPT